MSSLADLGNTYRPRKSRKRVGRGIGSNWGKTCGRGQKGAGSRSGYTRRYTYEGGQCRMFEKMPTRGFTRGRFLKRLDVINLGEIDEIFNDGDVVSLETLREKGYFSGPSHGIKILGDGELSKKVTLRVKAASHSVKDRVQAVGATLELV